MKKLDLSSTEAIWKETNRQIKREKCALFRDNFRSIGLPTGMVTLGTLFLVSGVVNQNDLQHMEIGSFLFLTGLLGMASQTKLFEAERSKHQNRIHELEDFKTKQMDAIAHEYCKNTDSILQQEAQYLLTPKKSITESFWQKVMG